jgi:hypothetical protein
MSCQGCSSGSVISLMPMDAGAAAEVAAGGLFTVPGTQEFMVFHSASVSTRTFRYVAHTGTRRL